MPSPSRWTLVATILASSMTFIDATVVNVALPALQADLHATITDVQWVIEAYALFLGALILVGGSMGDQFGRKRVFLFGVLAFTAASILCGIATSPGTLIAGRALQGIGAAFLVPGSLAIISATFPDAERGRAIGTWSGFSAITTAIGPVSGGWLIEHVSWRAAFFLNVPIAHHRDRAVAAIHERKPRSVPNAARSTGAAGRWPSSASAASSSDCSNGRRSAPPIRWCWARWRSACSRSLLLFVVERRAQSPMLPLALFRSRTFTLANVLTLLLYAALSVVLFLVPLNLIQVQHYTATAAGAALLPFPVIMFALSRWSGGLVARIGSRLPLTVGPAIAALGLALVRAAGNWRLLLDDVLSRGRRARARHGRHGRAADDDGHGCRRCAARRRGVRHQQRGGPRGRSPGDCGLQRRLGTDVRRARQTAARSASRFHRRPGWRSIANCPRWPAPT